MLKLLGKVLGFLFKSVVIAIGAVFTMFAGIATFLLSIALGFMVLCGLIFTVVFLIGWWSGDAESLSYLPGPLILLLLGMLGIHWQTMLLGGVGRALFRKPKVEAARDIGPYHPYAPNVVARRVATARRPMALRR
jgi:hypothetical protein